MARILPGGPDKTLPSARRGLRTSCEFAASRRLWLGRRCQSRPVPVGDQGTADTATPPRRVRPRPATSPQRCRRSSTTRVAVIITTTAGVSVRLHRRPTRPRRSCRPSPTRPRPIRRTQPAQPAPTTRVAGVVRLVHVTADRATERSAVPEEAGPRGRRFCDHR